MPRASKYRIEEEKFKELHESFLQLISSLNYSGDIETFFDEFLTPEEKIMLTKRLVLFMMIKKDFPLSSIRAALHVSPETIRLYRIGLTTRSVLFHKAIDKLIAKKRTKEFFQKIEGLLKPLELALRSKNDMKARAEFTSGA